MSANEETVVSINSSRELTPEEARQKRAYYLELYRAQAKAGGRAESTEVDAADSTMATFILPGD